MYPLAKDSTLEQYYKEAAEGVINDMTLKDGTALIRVYGVLDNPKGRLQNDAGYFGTTLQAFIEKNKLVPSDLWDNEEDYLWFANLYPVCETKEEAVEFAVILGKMAAGEATEAEINRWKQSKRESLCSSFNKADVQHECLFERELESRILGNCQNSWIREVLILVLIRFLWLVRI